MSQLAASLERRFLPWAFGFAPAVLFLLTWTDHFHNWWIKTYALPVVAVELTVVIVAFREGMRISLNRITACLAGLLILAWITAIFAPRPDLAIARTALWTLHALFGFAVARKFDADDLTNGLMAGFVAFVLVLSIYVATAPLDISWIYQLPGLGNIRRFGFYAAAIFGLCLGRLVTPKWPVMATLTLAFAMAFWSGSRGAIISALVSLAASIFLFPALRPVRVWGTFLGCGLAGAAIAALIGSPAKLQGASRLSDAGDNGRMDVWRTAIDLIGNRPWFGYGEGQMRDLSQMIYVMHPHNIALQLLLAWGVIGLALAGILGFWVARRMIAGANEKALPHCCAAIILATYSLIDGALYNVHPVAIFAACVGVALGARRSATAPRALAN